MSIAMDVSTVQLETLFAKEIPCGTCGRPAKLRSFGHLGGDCGLPTPGPFFKCVVCYQEWAASVAKAIAQSGAVRCRGCKAQFTQIDWFALYRTF